MDGTFETVRNEWCTAQWRHRYMFSCSAIVTTNWCQSVKTRLRSWLTSWGTFDASTEKWRWTLKTCNIRLLKRELNQHPAFDRLTSATRASPSLFVSCSDRQRDSDEKNLERMIKELARTEEIYDVTLEDVAAALLVNNATRETLEAEEEKTLRAEEALRVRHPYLSSRWQARRKR